MTYRSFRGDDPAVRTHAACAIVAATPGQSRTQVAEPRIRPIHGPLYKHAAGQVEVLRQGHS